MLGSFFYEFLAKKKKNFLDQVSAVIPVLVCNLSGLDISIYFFSFLTLGIFCLRVRNDNPMVPLAFHCFHFKEARSIFLD